MSKTVGVHRRDFVKGAVGAAALAGLTATGAAAPAAQSSAQASDQPAGANDRINVGLIGVGERGSSLMRLVLDMGERRGDGQTADSRGGLPV